MNNSFVAVALLACTAGACAAHSKDVVSPVNQESQPIACAAGALDADGRVRSGQLLEKLAARIEETKETEDGYAFRLSSDAGAFRETAEWITLERLCCPFLSFEMAWSGGGSPWLRISGPEGTKEFLRAELPELRE